MENSHFFVFDKKLNFQPISFFRNSRRKIMIVGLLKSLFHQLYRGLIVFSKFENFRGVRGGRVTTILIFYCFYGLQRLLKRLFEAIEHICPRRVPACPFVVAKALEQRQGQSTALASSTQTTRTTTRFFLFHLNKKKPTHMFCWQKFSAANFFVDFVVVYSKNVR